jgi:hypothetical protein
MAVEKIVNVTIKDNANDVEKDINKLNKAGENLESTFKDVNHTFEDVYGDLQPLTTRLGEAEDRMYELALAGKQNTQEYRELLQATANYRKVQIQTDLVVDTAAQTMSQKLGGALEGAASSFALAQGAMNLFGNESEEVEKALLKVQSAMALAQGIEGVRTALPLFTSLGSVIKTKVVTAFTSLKGAIAATGIGALVVAIGSLIYAMDEYNSTLEEEADNLEKVNEQQQKGLEIINKVIAASEKQRNDKKGGLNDLERELDLLKAKGATEEEIYNKSKEILDKEKSNLKIKYYSYDQSKKLEREAAWETYYQIKDIVHKQEILDIEYTKSLKDQEAERQKDRDEKRADRIAKEKELSDKLKQIELERVRNLKQIEQEFLAELEGAESEYFDSLLSEQEREVRAVEDKYFRLLELAEQYKVDTTTLELARESELATIRNKYKEDDIVTTQETEDDKTAIKLQAASNVLNILSLLSNIGDQESKKTFQLQKAVGLAQATIDTYKGAASAYANTVGGPVIKGIAAGVAVAAGLANVKKIASTEFSPSSTSTPSITSPTISSPSTQQLSTPNFNVVGATGISQTEELQPVKAYVVSGDVTTAQSLDRNRIQNATF